MQPDGKLIAIKKEAKHAEFAREHFNSAGLDDEIDVRVGDAHRILIDLRDEVPSDFVFINSDRPGSPAYFDWAIDYLQVRGVIAVNNPFW